MRGGGERGPGEKTKRGRRERESERERSGRGSVGGAGEKEGVRETAEREREIDKMVTSVRGSVGSALRVLRGLKRASGGRGAG